MEFTLAKEVDYIPDIYDNLSLPDDEQVVITVKLPNAQETQMLADIRGSGDGLSKMSLAVARLVKEVRNLKINGKEIKTGQELIQAPGMYLLVQSIGSHLLGMITELEADPT